VTTLGSPLFTDEGAVWGGFTAAAQKEIPARRSGCRYLAGRRLVDDADGKPRWRLGARVCPGAQPELPNRVCCRHKTDPGRCHCGRCWQETARSDPNARAQTVVRLERVSVRPISVVPPLSRRAPGSSNIRGTRRAGNLRRMELGYPPVAEPKKVRLVRQSRGLTSFGLPVVGFKKTGEGAALGAAIQAAMDLWSNAGEIQCRWRRL